MNFKALASLVFCGFLSLSAQIGAAQAGALSDSPAVSESIQFGVCTLQKKITVGPSTASLVVKIFTDEYIVGGSLWQSGGSGPVIAYTGNSGVTAAQIAGCLGINSADVIGLSQNGADGPFADDTGFFLEFSTTASTYVNGTTRGFGTFRFEMPGTDSFTASANTAKPVADAGPEQTNVEEGSTVTLDGSATDADANTNFTYLWSYVSGEQVTLSSTTTEDPTFEAPQIYGYPVGKSTTLRLVVNDGTSDSVADFVTINYGFVPGALHNAGTINEDITFGTCVIEKRNYPANGIARIALFKGFTRTHAGGTRYTGFNTTPGEEYDYVEEDFGSGIYGDDLEVCLGLPWTRGVSNVSQASPDRFHPDSRYTPDDRDIFVQFTTLLPAYGRQPGTYRFSLINGNTYPAATVTAPTASAGPDQLAVASGATVTLNGSGSRDADADTTLTYTWTQTSGDAVVLTGANTAQPTFPAPVLLRSDSAKTFAFQLAVSDGGTPVTDTVTITVLPPKKLLQEVSFTNPGNQNFVANSILALTASSTTPDKTVTDPNPTSLLVLTSNTPLICTVDDTDLTMVALGTCSITASKLGDSEYADATPVTHTFRLLGENTKPVAEAGDDQTIPHDPNTQYVYLNGAASSDPDGDLFTYAWTQKSGPTTVTLDIASISPAEPVFLINPVALGAPDDVFEFELVVTDEFNLKSDVSTVTITVQAPPKRNQYIFITTEVENSLAVEGQTWTPDAVAKYEVVNGNSTESFPSGLPVTITIHHISAAVCTETNGVVSFIGVGLCDVEFSQAGNGSYEAAIPAGREITVSPAPPALLPAANTRFTITSTDDPSAIIATFSSMGMGSNPVYSLPHGQHAGFLIGASDGAFRSEPIPDVGIHPIIVKVTSPTNTTGITQTYELEVVGPGVTITGDFPTTIQTGGGGSGTYEVTGGVPFTGGQTNYFYTLEKCQPSDPDPFSYATAAPVVGSRNEVDIVVDTSGLALGEVCMQLSASDAEDNVKSIDIYFEVVAPEISFTGSLFDPITKGDTVSSVFQVTGGVPLTGDTDYTYRLQSCQQGDVDPALYATAVPLSGSRDEVRVSINSTDMLLGDFCFILIAEDGQDTSAGLTIESSVIAPPPAGISMTPESGPLAGATKDVFYTQTFTATYNEGCDLGRSKALQVCAKSSALVSFNYSLVGDLPAGITLNGQTGVLSGTPTEPGDFDFAVTATINSPAQLANSAAKMEAPLSGSLTQYYNLNVAGPVVISLSMTPAAGALPGATKDVNYTQTFIATNNDGCIYGRPKAIYGCAATSAQIPFAYSSAVALPTGLTLNGTTGELSGTPTEAGDFNFSITATLGEPMPTANGAAQMEAPASGSITQNYSLNVAEPVVPVASMTPEAGLRTTVILGEAFNQTIVATLTPNDSYSVAYTISAGGLPAGVTLNATSGVISGNPTTVSSGSYVVLATFTKSVIEAKQGIAAPNYTVEQRYYYTISPSAIITVLNTTMADGSTNTLYSHDFDASGDEGGNYRFFISDNDTLPDGLVIDATTGVVSGVPTTAGTYTFLVIAAQASNEQNLGTAWVTLTIVEKSGPPEESDEISDIQEDGSYASATISGEIITETVGDAASDALNDSSGSSPLVGYDNGAMIIISKAKATPGVEAIDELTKSDRLAMRKRAGGSLPGLFHAYGEADGAVAADQVDPARWSVWGSVRGSALDLGASYNNLDGTQINLLTGASYRWSPNVVVGVFTGYETFNFADDVGAELSGNGFTVGAYTGFRPSSGLRFDGQISSTWLGYDSSSGAVTGSFDGTRIIASAAVIGSHSANGFLFEPSLRMTGTWETQSAYVDSAATPHAARSFYFGKVSAGVKASKTIQLSDTSSISPFAGLFADYRFSGGDVSATGEAFDDLSARATLGFNAKLNQSTTLGVNGEFSGLGLDDALLWSLKAQLDIEF